MTKLRQLTGLVMALGIVLGIASAGVSYNSDVFGKGAPYISIIDPTGDKVTVTNPGQPVVGNLKFINVFGQTLKNEGIIELATGDTVFDVVLNDRGNVGIHTAYYVVPTKEQVALGELGLKNNDDLAMASVITYLPASHMNDIYKLGKNGVWGWVTN
jgi:hypothetical protein